MHPFLKIKITHQGKPFSENYYNNHPEIHYLYPTQEVFMSKLYFPLLQKAKETNAEQLLEISEEAIKINGVVHKLS